MFDWVTDNFQLVLDNQERFGEYLSIFIPYSIILAGFVFALFLICVSIHSAIRRIEQKVNYLLGDNLDDFEKNRKAYKIYR